MVALLFVLFSLAFAELAPLRQAGEVLPGRYIVSYKNEVEVDAFLKDVKTAIPAENILHVYQHAMKGFSATMTDEQLATVRNNPLVDFVEADQMMHVAACSAPQRVESWGLTRISQVNQNLNSLYVYPTTAGEGVDVYVIDTGIYVAHQDFTGRATFGFKAEVAWSDTDRNGHGTHVASTSVGIQYGVARKSNAIAVKVLGDNGSGSNAGVIAGVEWTIQRHLASGRRSVINMSLGGGLSTALNNAVNAAVRNGIPTAVAAGNNNGNACSGSPSGAADVLTVGSTDVGLSATDIRSYFSNWGPCVDIFAPGSDITAAWIGSFSAVNTISGTSMASPHVAGICALVLGENPSWSAVQVQNQVVGTATQNKIRMDCSGACGDSANLMAFNGCVVGK